MLGDLKSLAKERFRRRPQPAIITVSAAFNAIQGEETKQAAASAGLQVLRRVKGSTAAAVADAFQTRPQYMIHLVDFGGCPHDVSLMDVNEMKFEVLVVDRDNHLGGRDFDARLTDHCLAQCRKLN
jgi:molecular chaperone DnaK (HSP70)